MGCTAGKEKPVAGSTKAEGGQQGASGNQKKVKAKYYMKVLMVGTSACGKSTVAKQMKILHCNGFTPEERDNYKKILISNIFLSLKELVTQAQLLKIDIKEEDIAEEIDKLDPFAVTITPQLIQDINKLWEDKGIQATYARRNEFDLPTNTEYCVTHAAKLTDPDYKITDEDILHARQRTTGIVENEFQVGKFTWNLIDVGGQRAERRKWVHFYEGVVAMIYVAALDEWDVVLPEDPKKMRMEESLEVFESMINHEWFQQTPWILFLNKKDLFEHKLKHSDMSKTYSDYKGGNDFTAGVEFVKQKYLKQVKTRSPDDVYVHVTCALDTNQVKFVFDSVMDWIFRKRMEISGLS
jgi:guanine nucleotide-binding protein G(i) subunit alpha